MLLARIQRLEWELQKLGLVHNNLARHVSRKARSNGLVLRSQIRTLRADTVRAQEQGHWS